MPESTSKTEPEQPQPAGTESPDCELPGLPFDPQDRRRGYLYLSLVAAVFSLVWFARYAMEGFAGLGVFSDIWILGYVYSFFPRNIEITEWFRHFYRPLSWCMMYNVYHHLWDWWPYHIAFRTGIHVANAVLLFGIARRLRLHPAASLSAAVLFLAYPQAGEVLAFAATTDIACLLGLSAIFIACEWKGRHRSFLYLPLITMLIFVAACFYETGGALAATAGVILFVRSREHGAGRLRATLVSFAAWLPLGGYLALFRLTTSADTGERFQFVSVFSLPGRLFWTGPYFFDVALFGRRAWGLYRECLEIGVREILSVPTQALVFVLLLLLSLSLLLWLSQVPSRSSKRASLQALACGGLMVLFSLVPWMMTEEYPHLPYRLLYMPISGVAIFFAGVVHILLALRCVHLRMAVATLLSLGIVSFALISAQVSSLYRNQHMIDTAQLRDVAQRFDPPQEPILYLYDLPIRTQQIESPHLDYITSIWWAKLHISPIWAAWSEIGKTETHGHAIYNRPHDLATPEQCPKPDARVLPLVWTGRQFEAVDRFYVRFPSNLIGVVEGNWVEPSPENRSVRLRTELGISAFADRLTGMGIYVTERMITQRQLPNMTYLHTYNGDLAMRPGLEAPLVFRIDWKARYRTFRADFTFEEKVKHTQRGAHVTVSVFKGKERVLHADVDSLQDVPCQVPVQDTNHLIFVVDSAGDGFEHDLFVLRHPVLLQ